MRTVFVVAMVCLGSGCGLEAASDLSGDEVGRVVQPIFEGEIGSFPGIVGLTFLANDCVPAEGCRPEKCTGAIVADGLVMTAGHCLRRAGWGSSGQPNTLMGEVAITTFDTPTQAHRCLTSSDGDLAGTCDAIFGDVVVATGVIHPRSVPNSAAFDIGLLNAGTSWAGLGIDHSSVVRLALSSTRNGAVLPSLAQGDSFAAVGFGSTGSTLDRDALRFDQDLVDVDAVTNSDATGLLLRNDADTVRMCRGDSGSPAHFLSTTGLSISAGVLSIGSDDLASCSPVDTQQFWTMLQTSTDFIRSTIEQRFLKTCTEASLPISDTVSMNVLDCI